MNRSLHPWYYSVLVFLAAVVASAATLGGTVSLAAF
jgi:hypothetical protein